MASTPSTVWRRACPARKTALCLLLAFTATGSFVCGILLHQRAVDVALVFQKLAAGSAPEPRAVARRFGGAAPPDGLAGFLEEQGRLRGQAFDFRVRSSTPPSLQVDLVIAWHCEDLAWIQSINPALVGILSIILLHKVSEADGKDPRCSGLYPKVAFNVTYVRLPNFGRNVHAAFAYFANTYDSLATYTMILQAGHHWSTRAQISQFKGFSSNAEAVNILVPIAIKTRSRLIPVSPRYNGEPLLYSDRQSNVDKEAQDRGLRPGHAKLDAAWPDIFNQVRETYAIVFGGSPCAAPPELLFVPGFQFLVHRDALLARPREVWAALATLALACEASTYGLERLSLELLKGGKATAPLRTWSLPHYCPKITTVDTGKPPYFKEPHNAFYVADFWRPKWGCEPLSPFLLQRRGAPAGATSAKLFELEETIRRMYFRLRTAPPVGAHVDLVVTWHCEDLSWLTKIDVTLASMLSVILLHKIDNGDLERRRKMNKTCHTTVPHIPFNVTVFPLPNRGRDVHSVFLYINNTYNEFPAYAMFLQADQHWIINQNINGAQRFPSNGHAVNELIPKAVQQKSNFLPVMPYLGKEPVLYKDRESNVELAQQDAKDRPNWRKFMFSWSDSFNQARDAHAVIFGGIPCNLPEMLFVPGFQFVVSREAVLARPREVWAALARMSLACEASTYMLERLSLDLFNKSKAAIPPSSWRMPVLCSGENTGSALYLTEPANPYRSAAFWRKMWKCEPLSPFLLARANTSQLAKEADVAGKTRLLLASSPCAWLIVYKVWAGSTPEQYSSGADCLKRCCADPTCVGLEHYSSMHAQCYKFETLPTSIAGRQDQIPLNKFDAASPPQWSFFVKKLRNTKAPTLTLRTTRGSRLQSAKEDRTVNGSR